MIAAHDRLRAANPVPACPPPAIENLWARIELDGTLDSADQRRDRRHRHRPSQWVGRAALAVLVSLSLLIGVGAVVLLDGRSPPPATAPEVAVPRHLSSTQALVHILGVLRRPQTAADRALLSSLPKGLAARYRPIVPLMRLATTTPWGQKVFLVPAQPQLPTAQSIRKLPPALRRGATRRSVAAHRYGLAVFAGGGGCCATAADILAGRDYTSSGPPNELIIVVPDGVAKVTIRLNTGAGSKPPRTISTAVHHNVAAFLTPTAVETTGGDNMTWYAPSGKIIKRLKP